MPDTKDVHCPFLNRSDQRCAEFFNLDHLQQVVSQIAIAGDARQVNPHRPRGALIKRAETFLVHQPRGLGLRARAGDGEQRIVHDACEIHRVNDPMTHSAAASAAAPAAKAHADTTETEAERDTRAISVSAIRAVPAIVGVGRAVGKLPPLPYPTLNPTHTLTRNLNFQIARPYANACIGMRVGWTDLIAS